MEILDETADFEAFLPYLLHNKPSCGNAEVSVTDCAAQQGYGARASLRMPIGTFLEQVAEHSTWYAKDFHIFREVPSSSALLPEDELLLADDWLNWWWTRCLRSCDDYRFAYIGGADTSTPMHHDVMASYSWSANIHGRKHWLLVPPAQTHLLFKQQATANMPPAEFLLLSDLPADIRDGCYDPNVYPGVAKAQPIEFVQEEGDVLFVPSGWYHQVRNLGRDCACDQGITVSVNHNWMNGFNVYQVWRFLLKELVAVRAELRCMLEDGSFESPSVWRQECDKMLRANSAINVNDFLGLVFSRVRFYYDCLAAAGVNVPQQVDPTLGGLARRCELQSRDIALVRLLVRTRVTECPSEEHQPANYEFSFSTTGATSETDELVNITPASTQSELQEFGTSSVNALGYELLQVCRILSEMQSCEAFLLHMAASLSPVDASDDSTALQGEQLCHAGRELIRALITALEQLVDD